MLFGIDRLFSFILKSIINFLLKLLLIFEPLEMKLQRTESVLLKSSRRFYEEKFITVEDVSIRTVIFNPGVPNRPPLVLLHGLNSGLCSFLQNVRRLSRNCTVYVIDLPGFARSTRPRMDQSVDEIEANYVRWLDLWRQNLAIEKYFLLGHDFGGYIATLYSLKYPWRVCRLTLYEPWGFPILPFGMTDRNPNNKATKNCNQFLPNWINTTDKAFHFVQYFNFVFKIVCFWCRQLCNVYGLFRHPCQFIQDLNKKKDPWLFYKTLCENAQKSSGKNAYSKLSVLNTWARDPLIRRIHCLDDKLSLTFIFGSKSWFDHRSAYEVKCSRTQQDTVNIHIIDGEGHIPIHQESPREFEYIVLQELCTYEDDQDEGWIEDDWISHDYTEDETFNII